MPTGDAPPGERSWTRLRVAIGLSGVAHAALATLSTFVVAIASLGGGGASREPMAEAVAAAAVLSAVAVAIGSAGGRGVGFGAAVIWAPWQLVMAASFYLGDWLDSGHVMLFGVPAAMAVFTLVAAGPGVSWLRRVSMASTEPPA